MNLGTYLTRSARYWPDYPALVCGDRIWTYGRAGHTPPIGSAPR